MANVQRIVRGVTELVQSDAFEQFQIDARDFISARQGGESAVTQISQMAATLEDAAEVLNRSFTKDEKDLRKEVTNVISPVVIPKRSGSYFFALTVPMLFLFIGLAGQLFGSGIDLLFGSGIATAFFGAHYFLLVLLFAALNVARARIVMVPDGSHALITKFGKLEEVVGPGRKFLGFHPRRKVSYIVNTTKEYPYNAPIREAPTSGRVNASVDLFLQFRIEDPVEFIFTLGGVNGFSEKLHNAISEVTRALIYEQKAEGIYDLIGESTQGMLETLNRQFLPAVRFVNANITHAEPSSQEYRMDLAAAEVVKVAKEAYTYQYELELRKSQDEGDLNKELASLRQTHSEIRAEIATSQAEIDTAQEKAINHANAYARQLLVEARSEAQANAALLEAQALDIRTVNSAYYPEILEYRYKREVLDKITAVADKLPQIVNLGEADQNKIDFMEVARQMMGIQDKPLYTEEDIKAIRARANEIMARIKERTPKLNSLVERDEDMLSMADIDPTKTAELEAVLPPAAVIENENSGEGGS
ncbi:SPFH domain-containing protein [Candidatus Leptofilum sp.]|uniref:SPFH domain-containing protein n=1 Tax=Candidatus Leptofilum sp. TaxID=3241576 RepID=UPI003B5A2B63